jgi:peptide methionine sulfoxide reductase MsrA
MCFSPLSNSQIAEAAKANVPGAVTELAPLKTFYPAEAYHQQYLEKVRAVADSPSRHMHLGL